MKMKLADIEDGDKIVTKQDLEILATRIEKRLRKELTWPLIVLQIFTGLSVGFLYKISETLAAMQ